MKKFIEDAMIRYPSIFPNPAEVIHHIFAVNGNGISLNEYGLLVHIGETLSYTSTLPYIFPKPVKFESLYSLTKFNNIPRYMKYKGCTEGGFNEAVIYFTECIKLSESHKYASVEEWINEIPYMLKELIEPISLCDEADLMLEELKGDNDGQI